MCEHSRVSDAVALRREARRRKILENSANRLRLIEGVNSFGGPLPSESVSKSVAKFEAEGSKCNSSQNVLKETNSVKFETSSKFKDVIKQNEDWKKILNYLLENNEVESEESEVEVEETETVTVINQQKEDSFLNVLHKKKLHYVLLALTVNALLYFNLGYFFYENIFCPFYTVKTIELISKREEKEDLQPFLFILLASLPKKIQKSAKIMLSILPSLFSDLFLYIFTFIVGTKILSLQV